VCRAVFDSQLGVQHLRNWQDIVVQCRWPAVVSGRYFGYEEGYVVTGMEHVGSAGLADPPGTGARLPAEAGYCIPSLCVFEIAVGKSR